MATYILRRLLLIIPTLLLVTVIVFLALRLIPGNIVELILSRMDFVTGADREKIEHLLGFDVPIYIQYFRWLGDLILHGDLGKSLVTELPVLDEILIRLPVTFELGIIGILIALIIAVPIGIYSAVRHDTIGDYLGRSLGIICIAIPSFWLGTMVMVFPSLWWGWSPPIMYTYFSASPIVNLQTMLVPATILGFVLSGITMRMTRTMMLEVLRQDYIRTSWAKGLREREIIMKHALPNALIPIVTIVGLFIPYVIAGAVVIEEIFCLPGLGRLLVESLKARDYVMVSGINLFFASFVLLANIIVDLTYAYLDPRIRYD